jgi:hypothetical protein
MVNFNQHFGIIIFRPKFFSRPPSHHRADIPACHRVEERANTVLRESLRFARLFLKDDKNSFKIKPNNLKLLVKILFTRIPQYRITLFVNARGRYFLPTESTRSQSTRAL